MRGRIKTRTRSPGSPQLASQNCVLLLEGREEGGTWPRKQPPWEMRLFLRVGRAGRTGVNHLLYKEPSSLPGFWPVTVCVLPVIAYVPKDPVKNAVCSG